MVAPVDFLFNICGGAILVEDYEGAQRSACAPRGACLDCDGEGAPGGGACGRCGPGEGGSLAAEGRAVTL